MLSCSPDFWAHEYRTDPLPAEEGIFPVLAPKIVAGVVQGVRDDIVTVRVLPRPQEKRSQIVVFTHNSSSDVMWHMRDGPLRARGEAQDIASTDPEVKALRHFQGNVPTIRIMELALVVHGRISGKERRRKSVENVLDERTIRRLLTHPVTFEVREGTLSFPSPWNEEAFALGRSQPAEFREGEYVILHGNQVSHAELNESALERTVHLIQKRKDVVK